MPATESSVRSLLEMPDGCGESRATAATFLMDTAAPPADFTNTLSICRTVWSAPPPRITNDMLPRGRTLPPAEALFAFTASTRSVRVMSWRLLVRDIRNCQRRAKSFRLSACAA